MFSLPRGAKQLNSSLIIPDYVQFDLLMMSTWCSKHVGRWNKYINTWKSASSWLLARICDEMHRQQNIKCFVSWGFSSEYSWNNACLASLFPIIFYSMSFDKFKKNKGLKWNGHFRLCSRLMTRGFMFLQVRNRGIRFLSCWVASVGIWLPTFRDNSAVLQGCW